MEIQINKKNIKKRLNTDTDIGGVCGGDVGTILVTEFVLYFSLSKQYPAQDPDKHESSPPLTNTELRCMQDMFHKPAVTPLVCIREICAKINSVKGRKGGQHLAVDNYYIIHLSPGLHGQKRQQEEGKKVIKNHWTG